MKRHAELSAVGFAIARGRPEEAIAKHDRLLEAARSANEVDVVADLEGLSALIELFRGNPARARQLMVGAIRRALAAGDRWALSDLRVGDACISVELDSPEDRASAVARFLDAFDQVPNDTFWVRVLMDRLVAGLESVGDLELAAAVRSRRDARDRVHLAGFAR